MNKQDQNEDENLDDDPYDEKDGIVLEDDDDYDKASVTSVPVKINKEARKKLEELMEEKRLKKMIEDDFFGLDTD